MKDYKHLEVTSKSKGITLKEALACIALISLLTIDWATLLLGA
tara:strand:+ start:425 stop:553 length:129 start_codon:yes stop_codon:yes gene_type:complete